MKMSFMSQAFAHSRKYFPSSDALAPNSDALRY